MCFRSILYDLSSCMRARLEYKEAMEAQFSPLVSPKVTAGQGWVTGRTDPGLTRTYKAYKLEYEIKMGPTSTANVSRKREMQRPPEPRGYGRN